MPHIPRAGVVAARSLLPITELPLSTCHAVTAGYECEPYNNPADFFLDIINGDSTAVMVNKTNEDNSGTRQRAECNICLVSAARCPAQHRHIPHSARRVVTVLYTHTVICVPRVIMYCRALLL